MAENQGNQASYPLEHLFPPAEPKNDPLRRELIELIERLHSLGKELPEHLVSLTHVVQPKIPNNMRIPLLGQLFETLPGFIDTCPDLQSVVLNPPETEVTLRLLLDLRQLQQLLQAMSLSQLLEFTNNVLPDSPTAQLNALSKMQEYFQSWTRQTLRHYNTQILQTPQYSERQQLIQLEPEIPASLMPLLLGVFKLPLDEVESIKQWFTPLAKTHLILLVNLLQLGTVELIEIRRRLTQSADELLMSTPSVGQKRDRDGNKKIDPHSMQVDSPNGYGAPPMNPELQWNDPMGDMDVGAFPLGLSSDGLPIPMFNESIDLQPIVEPKVTHAALQPITTPVSIQSDPSLGGNPVVITTPTASTTRNTAVGLAPVIRNGVGMSTAGQFGVPAQKPIYQLRVARQPPNKTVYKRILKPYPTIMLVANVPTLDLNANNLFVEAELVRGDSEQMLPLCLEGNRVVRISTTQFGTFKRLKVLSTTKMQGTPFRLKFSLKKYNGTVFETIPGVSAISGPIEVYSHVSYLKERKNNPVPPPAVTEIFPRHGTASGQTRSVILGANFVNSPDLRVRFGNRVVTAQFHEAKTLIVSTPPGPKGTSVKVCVSNDGKEFCGQSVEFYYT